MSSPETTRIPLESELGRAKHILELARTSFAGEDAGWDSEAKSLLKEMEGCLSKGKVEYSTFTNLIKRAEELTHQAETKEAQRLSRQERTKGSLM